MIPDIIFFTIAYPSVVLKILGAITFFFLFSASSIGIESDSVSTNIVYDRKVNGNWEVFGFHANALDLTSALQKGSIPHFPQKVTESSIPIKGKNKEIKRSELVMATVHFFPPYHGENGISSSRNNVADISKEKASRGHMHYDVSSSRYESVTMRHSTTPFYKGIVPDSQKIFSDHHVMLSLDEEDRLLEVYRAALLQGSPWVVLTGTTWEDCTEQLDFLFGSPDVPRRLFSDSVIRDLEVENGSEAEVVLLAKRLQSFFQVFSTTMGSWMDARDPLDALDLVPVLKDGKVHRKDYIVNTRGNNNKNQKDRQKDRRQRLSMVFALLSSSPWEERTSNTTDFFQYWKPSNDDDDVLVHPSAILEQSPRYSVIDGAPIVFPGVVSVTHPNIFYRMDLVTDALVSLWLLKEVKSVMEKFDPHMKRFAQVNEANSYSPGKSKAKMIVQLHMGKDVYDNVFLSDQFFQDTLTNSLDEAKIVVDRLQVALKDDDTIVGGISEGMKRSLMGNLLAATKRWSHLMGVENLHSVSSPWEHGWMHGLRLLSISLYSHFRMVQSSTPGFPASSNRIIRLAHYLANWIPRISEIHLLRFHRDVLQLLYDHYEGKVTLKALLLRLLGG